MKSKHLVKLAIATIVLIENVVVAYTSARWGKNNPIFIISLTGENAYLTEADVQMLVDENGDLKSKISDYELDIKNLTSQKKDLVIQLDEAIKKLNQEKSDDDIDILSSPEGITHEDSGIIWDILPNERLNGPDIRLPSDTNPFVMSGQQCYGVCVGPSWDRYINTYLYLNHEFSDVSFKIGHIDKTQERDIQVTIFLDEVIYEQPYTITYSEQPREFSLSGLDNVGTVVIKIDNAVDNLLTGPSYGITDIYLSKSQ